MSRDFFSWLSRSGIKIKRSREERLALQIYQACQVEVTDKDKRINELESLLREQNSSEITGKMK